MDVDVLSIASDGALVVQIAELVRGEPRARQAYTCTVYGNTSVVCPAVPAPSPAEWALLAYLGRQFVEGAPWDAQHHWRRTEHNDQFDLTEDFTLQSASGSEHTTIHELKVVAIHNGGYSKQREDVTIVYNQPMERPETIHDDFTAAADNGQDTGHAAYDFQLLKDSFARAAAPGTHTP